MGASSGRKFRVRSHALIYWARGFFYFGFGGGFGRVPEAKLQPVYIVIMIEAMIFVAMMTYGGVESSDLLFEK